MKKTMGMLLAAVLLAQCAGALAQTATIDVVTYDFRNDLSSDALSYDLPDEALMEAASGEAVFYGMAPLDNGGIVLCGTYMYKTQRMEESFGIGFETMPQRTDAYAIALNKEGKRLWTLRIGDPQTEINSFQRVWRMEDGRLLLRYYDSIGSWGTQYYIVNQDGKIDEMLSSRKLREAGILESAQYFPEGYLGGSYEMEWGGVSQMREDSAIVFLDRDLSEQWRLSDPALVGASLYMPARRTGDGFLLYGCIGKPGGGTYIPTALKVSLDGEITWQFLGHKYAVGSIEDAWPTADGGALCINAVDLMAATPIKVQYEGMLTKLNADGTHAWSQSYGDSHGVEMFQGMHPMGEGFLLSCSQKDGSYALMYVNALGEVLGFASLPLLSGEKAEYTSIFLAEGQNGGVYVFGNETYYEENGEGAIWSFRNERTYYALVTAEDFLE